MDMVVLRSIEDVRPALFQYHSQLAKGVLALLGPRRLDCIVEIGAGSGAFTLPLLEALGDAPVSLVCVDTFRGIYSSSRPVLEAGLASTGSLRRVKVLEGDARRLDALCRSVDLVVGHDVLCEFDEQGIYDVLQASNRALAAGGTFIHSGLSPIATCRAEELVILADDNPNDGRKEQQWFSPPDDILVPLAGRAGFDIADVESTKIPIRFVGEAALEVMRLWNTSEEFIERHREELDTVGIELPAEQVLVCRKSSDN